MSGPNGENCGDCYFWRKSSKVCCRYPPSEINTYTDKDEWCGEFLSLEVWKKTHERMYERSRKRIEELEKTGKMKKDLR